MARQQHRQGRVRRLAATIALAVTVGVLGAGCDALSTLPEQQDTPPPTAQQDGPPAIGAGDPMLGVTDGVDRPALDDIPADELETTNALEAGEKFRRTFEDETLGQEQWTAALTALSDPTFAVSLARAERGYFTATQSATVEVVQGYKLDNPQPYATLAAVDEEGNQLWTLRLAFKPSKADPSIGEWKAISVDWVDKTLSEDKIIPLTESERSDIRVTASVASSYVLSQSKGEKPEAREETLRSAMSEPAHAIKRGKPHPDQDVTVQATQPDSTYLVTAEGSSTVWVEVNGGYRTVGDDGDQGKIENVTVYVQMDSGKDGFRARDVLSEDEYHKAIEGDA